MLHYTALHCAGRCTIMSDMAEGLCARLYSARGTLADPALCPPGVSGKELAKVRDKLEKSFPETADLSKVPHTHSLTHTLQYRV